MNPNIFSVWSWLIPVNGQKADKFTPVYHFLQIYLRNMSPNIGVVTWLHTSR